MAHAMKKLANAEQEEEEEEEEKQRTRSCCVDVELMERELGCHVNKQEFVIYSNQFEVRRVDKELVNMPSWWRMSGRRWRLTCRWQKRLPRMRCT